MTAPNRSNCTRSTSSSRCSRHANEQFAVSLEGVAANDTDLIIDGSRTLHIVADTPGVNDCPKFPKVGACAVVADLLGEAVVWFALVPLGPNRTVPLPAIDTLDGRPRHARQRMAAAVRAGARSAMP